MMRHFKNIATSVLAGTVLLLSSCGPNDKKSERDTKRDQIRNYATDKRKELSAVAGRFTGRIIDEDGQYSQNVLLNLSVVDEIPTGSEEVDPVRIPKLTGFFQLGYTLDADKSSGLGFAIKGGDYDATLNRLTLTAQNSRLGEIRIEAEPSSSGLSGQWVAEKSSINGDVSLERVDPEFPLASWHPTPLNGEFGGYLLKEGEEETTYHLGKLIFQTEIVNTDDIRIKASLITYNGDWSSTEYLSYTLDSVEFNPLTGKMTLSGDASEITLTGQMVEREFKGRWSSKSLGDLGEVVFKASTYSFPEVEGYQRSTDISGTYYTVIPPTESTRGGTPRFITTNISATEGGERNARINITGHMRLYFGRFDSHDFVEVPFSEVAYNFYNHTITLSSSGNYPLKFIGTLKNGNMKGELRWGSQATPTYIEASREPIEGASTNMQGSYQGMIKWKGSSFYQLSNLKIQTARGGGGLIVKGSLKSIFGPWHSSEYLTYDFASVDFDPETSRLVLSSEQNEVSFQGVYDNGLYQGEWFTKSLGKMGEFRFEKSEFNPPSQLELYPATSGTYRGRIENTNSSTSLPEKMRISLAVVRDSNEPGGIKVTGGMRFYLGEEGSHEYVESQFTDITFHSFTREFSARADFMGVVLDLKGLINPSLFTGEIYHGGLGKVAQFEVAHD